MTTLLTFGVEFEMAVVDGFESGREFHTDTRIIDFSKLPSDEKEIIGEMEGKSYGGVSGPRGYEEPYVRVARHMAATLRAAGFESSVNKDGSKSWDFTSDLSIEDPPENEASRVRYTWVGIELRSPPMYFTPESLQAVADVLKLLKRTYCINTNGSTGLHVHVGDGQKGWPFHTMRKLFAFLWAFEHQLNTLFPPSRVDGEYTKIMRSSALYVHEFRRDKGRRPTPMEGLIVLLKCNSWSRLHRYFMPGTIRVNPDAMDRNGSVNPKPTVEWRHHEGTMDEIQTCMWIKTTVGMMEFLRSVEPKLFSDLLSVVEFERWEKLGDGRDGQREKEMGPVLAEGEFTVIDLLRTVGLYEPAKYYKERGLYKMVKQSHRDHDPVSYSWFYTLRDSKSDSSLADNPGNASSLCASTSLERVEIVDEDRPDDIDEAVDKFLARGLDA